MEKREISELEVLSSTIEQMLEERRFLEKEFLEIKFQYERNMVTLDWDISKNKDMLRAKVKQQKEAESSRYGRYDGLLGDRQ